MIMKNEIARPDPAGIQLPSTVAHQAKLIGQATVVEQARAVAEVQAAVVVAQQVPRSLGRVAADMREACGRLVLAERAFYKVPNRGTGPSIHLARELARIFQHIDYGVHELRRDDEAGESEIRAYAWDQQQNVRSSRTFIVPHVRMKKIDGRQTRDRLVDLGDIYLNNQNIGARAVRECIFAVLPAWFTEEAQELCRKTLNDGEGKPLEERIDDMIKAFRSGYGLKVDQLEQKIGKKRDAWQPADLAEMRITYRSLQAGETTAAEEFPQQRVTAAEIRGEPGPESVPPRAGEAAPPAEWPTPVQPGAGTPKGD